jgi:hypothetical protein
MQLGEREALSGVAQGAFVTKNDAFVARKDFKVLVVDASRMPAEFGSPPASRSNIAVSAGLTLLGCWTGA